MGKCPPQVSAMFSLSGGHMDIQGHMARAHAYAHTHCSFQKDTSASVHVSAEGVSGAPSMRLHRSFQQRGSSQHLSAMRARRPHFPLSCVALMRLTSICLIAYEK